MTTLAPVLQAFFTERLMAQRRASSHTITGYRDTLRLLVGFASAKTGKTPSALDIADLDAPLVAAFLDHLEADRHNTVQTRNWRLAAIHSLFGYAALHHPDRAAVIQRVLAIPAKRHERTLLTWLTAPEVDALLAAPDRGTWTGRRDHAMLVLAVQTGLRISELIGLSRGDVVLDAGAHVRCMGKGRKERATPLTGLTVAVLRAWLTENPGQAHDPLFPTRTGTRLSHDAIEHRLAVHLATARASCPSLRTKHATMHTLRHTCAMRLQGRGVASDATFRRRREDGAVRDGGPGTAGWRSRRQSERPGQGGCDRTVLRQMRGCCVHSGCIRRKHDAAKATKKRGDEGR